MNQATDLASDSTDSLWHGALRFWPLHLLAVCALYVLAGPAWDIVRMTFAGGAPGGVQVDTNGASGRMSRGRFLLDLPVDIINRSPGMVMGVSLWVETFACPDDESPTSACRRLTSFEQYVPVRLQPGSAESHDQQMNGIAPRPGEVLRIRRRLQSIDDGEPIPQL